MIRSAAEARTALAVRRPSRVSLLARLLIPDRLHPLVWTWVTTALGMPNPRYWRYRSSLGQLRRLTASRIVGGPFKGLRYIARSAGSQYGPKILGTYELELWPVIDEVIRRGYNLVIDVGAAEGYYAVGLAHRLPSARVIAFEAEPRARRLLRRLADLNGITRLQIEGFCTPDALGRAIPDAERPLIICDIEGAEDDVLRPDAVPALRRADVLVELHEFLRPGISAEIYRRFHPSHRIRFIPSEPRTSADWPDGIDIPVHLRQRLLAEIRPGPMTWFWMTATA